MFALERRARRALTVAVSAATVLLIGVTGAVAASTGAQALTITPADLQPGPEPTLHTPQARDPEDDFTARWTRADARQLKRMSDPTAGPRENSMPMELTMPTVPQNFPDMSNGQVWVWDTWPLTDKDANQYSFKGWEVIFSLIADRSLGFDDRHVFAKLGYFFRPAGVPWQQRPVNGGWTFGGRVFPEGASGEVFEDQSFSHQTEWSGSTRLFSNGEVKVFYTAVAFYRLAAVLRRRGTPDRWHIPLLQRLRILCAALSYGDGHGGREDVVLLLAGRRNLRRPRGSKPPIDHFVMVITSRTQGQR